MAQTIAPQVTDQIPPNPPMWRGGPQLNSSGLDAYGPPENWAMGPSPSANELMTPADLIAPVSGDVERLGAAYHIKASLPYHDEANHQPTRASEFYGWSGGR